MPSILGRLMNATVVATRAAVTGFREAFTASGQDDAVRSFIYDWNSYDARRNRYAVYWAMRSNNLYRRINAFAAQYKAEYGLYRFTQGLYNPAARLIEFHVSHLLGGALDPEAGDGRENPSCLPLDGIGAADRKAIAGVLLASRFGEWKGRWSRWGCALGDAPLRLYEDPKRRRVTIAPVRPSTLASLRWRGEDVVAAQFLERRVDPDDFRKTAWYREDIDLLDNGDVQFQTFRDDEPYPWNSVEAEWTIPKLGFVPVWLAQHLDVGEDWGESELESGRAKIDAVNDLASKLHDQIRKLVEGRWAAIGIDRPRDDLKVETDEPETTASGAKKEAGRQVDPIIYLPRANADGRFQNLVNTLPIGEITAETRQRLDNIEDDYPEMKFERVRTHGTLSGEALRQARQPAVVRVGERRTNYYAAALGAIRGALALAGLRGYPMGAGYGPDDYRGGSLAGLRVLPPPVFLVEEADRLAEETARATLVKTYRDAGVALAIAMRRAGCDPADIKEAVAEAKANQQMMLDATASIGPGSEQTPQTPGGAPNGPGGNTGTDTGVAA